ncbi:MAG: RDD family protein [Nocardioidaceae bacterium]|nr:RDD family protein [Nocardioidaceae bacterium]
MTQIPAGWYPDPAPAAPATPPMQRYWDGTRWTEHVQPAVGTGPVAYGGQLGGPAYAAQARPTTPDGEPLSGWWLRLAAYLIDAVVVTALAGIIGYRPVSQVASAYGGFIEASLRAAENGAAPPSQADLLSDIAGPLALFGAISLVVQFAYQVGFLKALAATPGKLLLGLRVRRREAPGPLGWRTVLLRWLGQFGPRLLALLPTAGVAGSLYEVVDGLWPLWDSKRQALHDKLAGTNVVRRPRR